MLKKYAYCELIHGRFVVYIKKENEVCLLKFRVNSLLNENICREDSQAYIFKII